MSDEYDAIGQLINVMTVSTSEICFILAVLRPLQPSPNFAAFVYRQANAFQMYQRLAADKAFKGRY